MAGANDPRLTVELQRVLGPVLRSPRAARSPLAALSPLHRQGQRSVVFASRRRGLGPLIVKLTAQRDSYPVESWVYQALAAAGVPVPRVHYRSPRLPGLGWPCLVMSRIDGEPLFEHDARQPSTLHLYADAGALLARMHAVRLPAAGFGLGAFLAADGGAAASDAWPDWTGFIAAHHAHPASGRQVLAHGLLPGMTQADLDRLDEAVSRHRFRAVLNHGDFGPDHILAHRRRIAGIIDPGEAFAGPREYDLAYLACYVTEAQFAHALRGYGQRVERRMIDVYAAIIALHKAARALDAGDAARAARFGALACARLKRGAPP